MRNISFALTTPQFLARQKDVTRRLGWRNLKAGDRLCAVKKSQGLKPGEKLERLGVIEVVSNVRQRLDSIGNYSGDTAREGFPEMSPTAFVEMFCEHMGCEFETEVSRIEFKVIELYEGGAQ